MWLDFSFLSGDERNEPISLSNGVASAYKQALLLNLRPG